MSYEISTAGSRFGYVTNILSTGILASGKAASTYKSNLQAFLDFLNQTIITPIMNQDQGRGIGSGLAAA